MDLAAHGRVRLTSEDPSHPIEGALQGVPGREWRAAAAGPQTLWTDFDVPQMVREIHLRFEQRTQEFVLLASSDRGRSYREIVRHQFHFSPENEDAG